MGRNSKFLRPSEKDRRGLRAGVPEDGRRLWCKNARFLVSDLFQRIPQDIHMVFADMRYYRYFFSRYRIRCVQPAAHAGLQDAEIRIPLWEQHHGDEKKIFEICRVVGPFLLPLQRPPVQHIVDMSERPQKILLGNHLSRHLEPLPDAHQMGRGEQGDPIPRRLQDAAQIGTNGTFPVCACHMEDAHPAIRISQPVEEGFCLLHRVFGSEPRRLIQIGRRLLKCSYPLSLHCKAPPVNRTSFPKIRHSFVGT